MNIYGKLSSIVMSMAPGVMAAEARQRDTVANSTGVFAMNLNDFRAVPGQGRTATRAKISVLLDYARSYRETGKAQSASRNCRPVNTSSR